METAAQGTTLPELKRRYGEARLDENYRAKSKLLVMMLAQCCDERGAVPEHFRELLREHMDELLRDLPRMTLVEVTKATGAIKIVSDSLPNPVSGAGFRQPLTLQEIAAIQAQHPVMRLQRPSKVNGVNGHGHANGNGNGNGEHEPDDTEALAEQEAEAEPVWIWHAAGAGPAESWRHRPRVGYRF